MKKLQEPLIDTIKNTSEKLTKNLIETSIKNNQELENLNEKVLQIMNVKGMISPHLASSLVRLFKPENKSQFRIIKDLNSNKMNNFLINTCVPVTLDSNMLTFRDTYRSFELDGELSKTMTNYKFNVDQSNPQDRKIIYELGKEWKFDIKQIGRPSNRDKSMIKLNNSPAIMASGISNTKFLPSDPNELCDRLKLLLKKKKPVIILI